MNNITRTIVPQTASIVDGTKTYVCTSEPGRATSEAKWSIYLVETGVSLLGKTATTVKLPCGPNKKPTSDAIFKLDDALTLTYSYVADVVVPTLSTVTIASNNTDTTKAKVGDTATITIVSSEALSTLTGTIAGHTATVTAGADAKNWTLSFVMTSGDTNGVVPFTIDFSDMSGNAGTQVVAVTGGASVTFDKTAPTAILEYSIDGGANYVSTISVKDADTLRIRATFSEALLDSPIVKLAIDNSILSATNMTKDTTQVYHYDLNVPAGDVATATCSLSVGMDTAGNVIVSAPTAGATFSVDNTTAVFTLGSVVSDNADPTKAKSGDTITAVFSTSETLAGNPTATFGGQAMTFGSLVGSNYTYTRVLNGTETNGTAHILVSGTDLVGNVTTNLDIGTHATDFTAPTFTVVTTISDNADTAKSKVGNTVTTTFTRSEALTANPTVTFGTVAMTYVSLVGTTYEYSRVLDGSETEGTAHILVTGTDLSGNTTTASDIGTFATDFTAPLISSVTKTNVTTLNVVLSEIALASTINKANDGGWVVYETGAPGTTYAVSGTVPGIDDTHVVLTVADMTVSAIPGVTVTYVAGVNGTVSDTSGNLLATNAVGVVTGAF